MLRRTVLIVDDSPEDRATFRRYLTGDPSCQYEIQETDLAEDALSLFLSETPFIPDCLLLDFNLPDAEGVEFLEELAQQLAAGAGTAETAETTAAGDRRLPCAVVMLTGSGDESAAVRAMKAGAQDYLPKGRLTAEDLRRAVDNACVKHTLSQQLREKEVRLRLATQAAGIGIWELTLKTEELIGEERFRTLHNLSERGSLNYSQFLARIHDGDRDRLQEVILKAGSTQAASSRGAMSVEYRLKTDEIMASNSSVRWIQLACQSDAPNSERLIGTVTDITDRKIIEEKRAEQAAQQERVTEAVQRSLLLAPPPDAYPGVVVATQYQAAWNESMIGGDFFDVFAVAPDQIALLVGDATGKGVEAATFTAEIKFALRAILRDCGGSPAQALTRLNTFVLDNTRLDAMHRHTSPTAAALAVMNTKTGEVALSTAGSEPPLILRSAASSKGDTLEVSILGPLLGIDYESTYVEESVALEERDILAITTDGITESRTPRVRGSDGQVRGGQFFGLEGLETAIREEARSGRIEAPGTEILTAVGRAVIERTLLWAGHRQHDDICLMLVQRR